MTPNWHWILNGDTYSASTKDLSLRLKCWSILLYYDPFSRYKVARKSEMHRITPNSTWTPYSQKYSITPNTFPRNPILVRCALRLDVSEIQDHQKSEMHWMTRNWTWTFNGQSTLYTLKTYHRGPTLCLYHSTTSHCRHTTCIRSPKIGNAPKESTLNLNT